MSTQAFASIRGMHFRPPAKSILAALPANHPILLQPEPDNPYDQNAIKVLVDLDELPESSHAALLVADVDIPAIRETQGAYFHLGYIAKEIAQEWIAGWKDCDIDTMVQATLAFDLSGKPLAKLQL